MKSYTYKLFDKDLAFKKILKVKSEARFSESLNEGQGAISIVLEDRQGVEFTDFIKIEVVNEFFPLGYQIYYGYVIDIITNITEYEEIELSCLGVGSLLERVLYKEGGNYEFTKNKTIKEHIEDIMNYFGTQYSVLSLGDIDDIAGNINIEFKNQNCFDALAKVCRVYEDTHYFHIDRLGQLQFKAYADAPIYRATFRKDIQNYDEEQNLEIVNRLILEWDGGTNTYEDITSINTYGVFERYILDLSIKNIATANIFGSSYIDKNKDIEPKIDIILNEKFDIIGIGIWDDTEVWNDNDLWLEMININKFEGLEVGDFIKILNKKEIKIGYIKKKVYNRDTCNIILGRDENLIGLIRNDGNNGI